MGTETTRYRIVLDDRLTPEMRKALTKAKAFDKELVDIDKHSKSAGSSLKSAFAGLAIGAGVGLLAKQILTLGINMEQTRVAFETFTGSAEVGNAVIARLNEFSNVTPFRNEQVLQAGKVLLAFGLEAEKLIPTLTSIGDMAAGTGKDFNELALIYGKAMTQGFIQGEELNQLAEAGIPIIAEFAKMFGVTEGEVKKLGSESKITFADMETAFQNMTGEGGRFFNLMAKQSQTLGGKLSTLVGKLELIGATIGENMTGGLGDFTTALIDFVDNNAAGIVREIGGITEAFGNLGAELVKVFTPFGSKGDLLPKFFKTFSRGLRGTIALIQGVVQALDGVLNLLNAITFAGIGEFEFAKILGKQGLKQVGGALDPFNTLLNQLRIEDADTERQKNKSDLPDTDPLGLAGGTTTADGTATAVKKAKKRSAVAGVQSKVRNITINIEKLVDEINFNNITSRASEAELTDLVRRAMLTAVNDVNVIAR